MVFQKRIYLNVIHGFEIQSPNIMIAIRQANGKSQFSIIWIQRNSYITLCRLTIDQYGPVQPRLFRLPIGVPLLDSSYQSLRSAQQLVNKRNDGATVSQLQVNPILGASCAVQSDLDAVRGESSCRVNPEASAVESRHGLELPV